jgi:hypothetical protein
LIEAAHVETVSTHAQPHAAFKGALKYGKLSGCRVQADEKEFSRLIGGED